MKRKAEEPKTFGLFINGTERASSDGQTFEVTNPMDNSVVGLAAKATKEDALQCLQIAKEAQKKWAALAPFEREKYLLKAADIFESDFQETTDILIAESGSTHTKAYYEVFKLGDLLRTAAGEVRRLYGDTFPNDRPHRMSIVVREPVGVVLCISPFNAPLALLAKMAVFAIAAGNSVIAKPASETPLCAVMMARLLHKAGLPPGVFNVLSGSGAVLGEPLAAHPDVDAVAFTGSTEIGTKLGAVCARFCKPIMLELGGKNPMVILKDFDITKAAAMTACGSFSHSGQICMASSRIIVERSCYSQFLEALKKKCESIYLGDLYDKRTAYGPLINEKALKKVQEHVAQSVTDGGRILTGGKVHDGLRFQPTVVVDLPTTSAVWREETFGPLIIVIPFDTDDEAVRLANDSDYGLSSGVLTNDMPRGLSIARRIRCGSVHLGTHSFQSDSLAPIGGYGLSGVGRSGGKFSIEHFTEHKWISFELGETVLPF
jgi:acyl-CoA reductase-like NAD-dependent aldehyde dehydrogenase